MNFLKGLALVLIGICLYSLLSVMGLLIWLQCTLLNPDFIIREVDELEIYEWASELAREQVSGAEIPEMARPYVDETLDDILVELEPWVEDQVAVIVRTFGNYFHGQGGRIYLSISLEPVRESIIGNLEETLSEVPPAVAEVALQEIERQVDEELPATLEIDQNQWDAEVVSVMEQVRQYTSQMTLMMILIGVLSLLLMGLVFLIHREIRAPARTLGIDLLVCGVVIFVCNLLARTLLAPRLLEISLPGDFQTKLPKLISDLYFPLDVYAVVVAVIGIVLLVVSFVYKPNPSDAPVD
jgi:hypothetical protein